MGWMMIVSRVKIGAVCGRFLIEMITVRMGVYSAFSD